jgi:hypothetical protein
MITFTVLAFFNSKLLSNEVCMLLCIYVFSGRDIKTIMAPFRNGVVCYNKAMTKGMEQEVLN